MAFQRRMAEISNGWALSRSCQVAECCHLVAKLTMLTGTTAVWRRFVGERLFHLVSPFMSSIKRLSSSKQALHHITLSYLFLASLSLFTLTP
jgi:hypothetical protein